MIKTTPNLHLMVTGVLLDMWMELGSSLFSKAADFDFSVSGSRSPLSEWIQVSNSADFASQE